MQDREYIVFERTRGTDQGIHEPCHVFVSPVLIPSSTNRWVDPSHPTRYLSHLPRWNFLLHATKKNSNSANFFVYLKQNNSEGFIGAP